MLLNLFLAFCFNSFFSFDVTAATTSSSQLIQSQVELIVNQTAARQFDEAKHNAAYRLDLPATRKDLVAWLYKENFIEASNLTLLLSDKLLLGKVLYYYLKDQAPKFHPPVMGIKEFLEKENFLDSSGVVHGEAQRMKLAFAKYFPEGFILKPPISWATDGKGFYTKEDEIIALLLANDSKLYNIAIDSKAFQAPTANMITSGERWMIMGKIKNTSILENKNYGISSEFRVHTYHNHVIQGGTLHRYGLSNDTQHFNQLNDYVQTLLDALPKQLTLGQAWGLDVFLQSDGRPIVVEINNNRGGQNNWSDFTRSPETLAAYVSFFESQYGWKFLGVDGKLMRAGLGNVRNHLKHDLPYYLDMPSTAKTEIERQMIVDDLKRVAAEFKQRLTELSLSEVETLNPNYQTTVYVVHEFSRYVNKIQKLEDASWFEFADWVSRLVAWDGKGKEIPAPKP